MVTVQFKKMDSALDLPLPSYATSGAAGMDVRSAVSVLIPKGVTAVVPTGLLVALPAGYEMQVRSRGGQAAKHAVFVTNGPGTIDEDYRGEIMVILTNAGHEDFWIERGDRIAQLVVAPYVQARVLDVTSLSATTRGEGRFNSTGRA